MECPKCKAEVSGHAQFCWRCGATLRPEGVSGGRGASEPGQPSRRWWLAVLALLVLALAVWLLLALGPSRLGRVTAQRPTGNETATPPLTAGLPSNLPQGGRVTGVPTTPLAPAPGIPRTAPPPAQPTEPFREDIAEYLRKLEAIQRRDEQNPMTLLTALLAEGLTHLRGGLPLVEEGGEPGASQQQYSQKAKSTIASVLREKQALLASFQAITPVPVPCRRLHLVYGQYLASNVKAIQRIQSAVTMGDIAGAMAALGPGRVGEAMRKAAADEEARIRARYHIPRTFESIVP